MSIIRDITLAPSGANKIDWVSTCTPVLSQLRERFRTERPFKGMSIAMSIHLEAKTAALALTLAAGGAKMSVTGSNPLSTQDDIAAELVNRGIDVYAWHGATDEEYTDHLRHTLACCPDIIIDDGGDLVSLLHGECRDYAKNVIGGCEETTTGVHRLRARHAAGKLDFPMIDVNDAKCKHHFDNRYGTGQSVWAAIMHTTNQMVTGKTVVVAGYGFCGRGVAMRAAGLGANVIVTEVDPHKALEALMDGYRVMTMDEAAPLGDIFVTVTGCKDIIIKRHFEVMKDGVLLSNAGHFDVEISKPDLMSICTKKEIRRNNIDGYYTKDGRILNVLGDGRLVNLAAGDGHPAEIMDMSFALQALCVRKLATEPKLPVAVYDVPSEIDDEVAWIKLDAMKTTIDRLTDDQYDYLKNQF